MDRPPRYEQPPLDQGFVALQKQTEQQQMLAAQETAKLDTARLMATYGTTAALGGVGGAASGGGAAGDLFSPLSASNNVLSTITSLIRSGGSTTLRAV